VTGLKAAKRVDIRNLKVFRDSKLVIKQVEGTYRVETPSLVANKSTVQKLMKHFTSTKCKMVNQNKNKMANSLATLATKYVLNKEKMTLQVEKQSGLIKCGLCLPKDW